jgi:hypothetical protein
VVLLQRLLAFISAKKSEFPSRRSVVIKYVQTGITCEDGLSWVAIG